MPAEKGPGFSRLENNSRTTHVGDYSDRGVICQRRDFVNFPTSPGRTLITSRLILPAIAPRMQHENHGHRRSHQRGPARADRPHRPDLHGAGHDHAPRPLPAAELRNDRGDPGEPEGYKFPGYRRRDGLHLGNITYHVGDLDRPAARPTHRADRPAPCGTRRARRSLAARSRRPISRPWARRRPSRSWSKFPPSAPCWPPTCRPPTTATRPASRWTK